METIRIATRASRLALIQANYVRNLLAKLSPQSQTSIVEVCTSGDVDRSIPLYGTETIGFFTSEVERALLEDKADLAVHSLKDLPTQTKPELTIAAIPRRESAADVIVSSKKILSISDLDIGSEVGTSSLRRIAQLKHHRSDLKFVPLRGNVETRVQKVFSGKLDAAVIAWAGLKRLGMSDKISLTLSPFEFIPAPGQGALAVQIRRDDKELAELVSKIDDPQSHISTETERYILSLIGGGCSIPLGVYCSVEKDMINIHACIASPNGKAYIKRSAISSFSKIRKMSKKR